MEEPLDSGRIFLSPLQVGRCGFFHSIARVRYRLFRQTSLDVAVHEFVWIQLRRITRKVEQSNLVGAWL